MIYEKNAPFSYVRPLYIQGEYTPSPLTNRHPDAFRGWGGAPALQLPAPARHGSSLPLIHRHSFKKNPKKTSHLARPVWPIAMAVATDLISLPVQFYHAPCPRSQSAATRAHSLHTPPTSPLQNESRALYRHGSSTRLRATASPVGSNQ